MEDETDNSNCEPEALPGPVLFYNEVVIDHFMHPSYKHGHIEATRPDIRFTQE
jgi:hypothetical protein